MANTAQEQEVASPETWRKFLEWYAEGQSMEDIPLSRSIPFEEAAPFDLAITFSTFLSTLGIEYGVDPNDDIVTSLSKSIVMETVLSHFTPYIPRYHPSNKNANKAYCKYCYNTHRQWSEFTDVFPGDVVWECQRCNHRTKDEYMQIEGVRKSKEQKAFDQGDLEGVHSGSQTLLPEDIALFNELKKQKKG
jgi:Zn-finger protein